VTIGVISPSVHASPFSIATMTQERSEMATVFAGLPPAVDRLIRNTSTSCPAAGAGTATVAVADTVADEKEKK